jgi:hypothetical protein
MKNQFSECFQKPVKTDKPKWNGGWLDRMKYAQAKEQEENKVAQLAKPSESDDFTPRQRRLIESGEATERMKAYWLRQRAQKHKR